MNNYSPPLQGLANNMAQHGRYGDSMLVHMNPHEVQGIASLSPTGQLTRNPMTGQPEAFLPFLAPLLGGALGLGSLGTAALGGAMTALQTGDLRKGILSGITGFGLGKLFEFAGGAKDLATDAAGTVDPFSQYDPTSWKSAYPQSIAQSGSNAATYVEPYDLSSGDMIENIGLNTDTQASTPWWAREGKTLGEEGFFDDFSGRITSKAALPGMLIAGTAGSELGRLETQEDLERQIEEDKLSQEQQFATSEEEIQRAMRQRIYDYGLPARNIQPRDPRYAPTEYANDGGLVSLNPMAYQNKRDGLAQLMGQPVRMQEGGYTPDIKASEAQSALRGSQLISAPQMQQLSASGYRPGFGPELQYFREPDRFGNDPFAGYLDPMNPNAPSVPTAGQLESEAAAAAAAAASQAAYNQSYDPSPTSDPLNFVTQGGEGTGSYLGGIASEIAPDTYFAPGITGVGQGYVSDFGGEAGGAAETIQNLDYSDYPKRSDFGSSDDGGHIEFKQAENEWFKNKIPSATIDPPGFTSPVMPPEAISPVVPMPPPPPIMDTPALPPEEIYSIPPMPPQEMAPIPPPPPVMQPIRSDYGAEEGMDYRNDLNAYRSVDMQPTPPVMPPPAPMPPSPITSLPTPVLGMPPILRNPDGLIDLGGGRTPEWDLPQPPIMQKPEIQPPVMPIMGQKPNRRDYGAEEGIDYKNDLKNWTESQSGIKELLRKEAIPPSIPSMIPPPVMAPPMLPPMPPMPPEVMSQPTMPAPMMQPPMMQPPPPAIIENLMRPEIAPPMMQPPIMPPPPQAVAPPPPVMQPPMPPPMLPPQAVAPPPPQAMPPMLPPMMQPTPPPPPVIPSMPPPVMQPPPAPPRQVAAPPVMQQPIPMPPIRRPVAPPPPKVEAPPPLPELGPRPRRSDYGREEGMDYKYELREWNEAKKAREEILNRSGGGITQLAKGGLVKMQDMGQVPEMPIDPAMMQADQIQEGIVSVDPAMQEAAMQDPTAGIDPAALQLVEQTAMAVLGQVPPEQADAIIQAFIEQFGPEAFQALRQEVLNSVEPGAQTEGIIQGQGDGMSDEIQGMIGDQQRVAVSPGEFIVPADVVSGIGNGSSDAGAGELDRMMDEIRQARTGMTQQPPAIDPRGAMPV